MHTFIAKHGTVFNYNSDLSGDVDIKGGGIEYGVKIPGEDIMEFVAEFVRLEKISQIEQLSVKAVLGLDKTRFSDHFTDTKK